MRNPIPSIEIQTHSQWTTQNLVGPLSTQLQPKPPPQGREVDLHHIGHSEGGRDLEHDLDPKKTSKWYFISWIWVPLEQWLDFNSKTKTFVKQNLERWGPRIYGFKLKKKKKKRIWKRGPNMLTSLSPCAKGICFIFL